MIFDLIKFLDDSFWTIPGRAAKKFPRLDFFAFWICILDLNTLVEMHSAENKDTRRVRTIRRHLTAATPSGELVDGYLVRPKCAPGMERAVGKTALSVVGGTVPLPQHEVARRAYRYTLDPMQNPIKQVVIT